MTHKHDTSNGNAFRTPGIPPLTPCSAVSRIAKEFNGIAGPSQLDAYQSALKMSKQLLPKNL